MVSASLKRIISVKDSMCSGSMAVISKPFVDKVLINLKQEIKRRKAVEKDGAHFVREPKISYTTHFGTQKDVLSAENTLFWDVSNKTSPTLTL